MHIISNIHRLLKEQRFSVTKMSELIGMSKNGLHLALKNNTLKLKDLDSIAKVLKVPIDQFFLDGSEEYSPETDIVSEENAPYNTSEKSCCEKCSTEKKWMYEKIEMLEKALKNEEEKATMYKIQLLQIRISSLDKKENGYNEKLEELEQLVKQFYNKIQ